MTVSRLNTGFTTTGAISYLGETDTYNTTFIQGLTYSVRVSGASSGGGSLADPNLGLYNTAGQRLLFNDDINPGVNRDSALTFTVNQTSDYRMLVGEQGNNATGSYTIAISAGYANNNNNTVYGTYAADAVNGMGGNDILNGGAGNDRLWGGTGNDQLLGGLHNDTLWGEQGNDVLRGGEGNDALVGGAGADRLIGGNGADRFVFNFASDSARGAPDTIAMGDGAIAMQGVGVAGGDIIDLSGIDANVNYAGNQAFTWSTSHAAGTLSLSEQNGSTVVQGHVNNDGIADFVLVIADGASINAFSYTSNEFVL